MTLPRPGRAVAPMALVERRAGEFALLGHDGRAAGPADGTFNFVRVQGETPGPGRLYVSPRLPHADLAQGRPVIYAGTAGFRRGALDWWSNHSGTYQPVAAFRDRARLPEDRFVPWQRLQMGGLAQQRGTFAARLAPMAPPSPTPAGAIRSGGGGDSGGRPAGPGPGPGQRRPAHPQPTPRPPVRQPTGSRRTADMER